jgi:hypothetical protein|tara:strand:- start:259 stop:687 length:429 start_codon:yes stop_codon:yes gene_type:complete
MKHSKLLKDLEEILESEMLSNPLPVVKGNSIRIKNYIVRKTKIGYSIYDCNLKQQITSTSFKKSAIAIAKTLSEGANCVEKIEDLDRQALKHYNDILVYKHTIQHCDRLEMKESRIARLSFSIDNSFCVAEQIENFIYNDKY